MEKLIAYFCLKVSENRSMCYVISLFYSLFLSKSLLKSVKLLKKEGGAIWRGALNGNNTVLLFQKLSLMKKNETDAFQEKQGRIHG